MILQLAADGAPRCPPWLASVDANERKTLARLTGDEIKAGDVTDQLDRNHHVRIAERNGRFGTARLECAIQRFSQRQLGGVSIDHALVSAAFEADMKAASDQSIDEAGRLGYELIVKTFHIDGEGVLDGEELSQGALQAPPPFEQPSNTGEEGIDVADATDENIAKPRAPQAHERMQGAAHRTLPALATGDDNVPIE